MKTKIGLCTIIVFALTVAMRIEAQNWHGPAAPSFYNLQEYDGNTGPSVPVGKPAEVERTSPDSFVVANGTGNTGFHSSYFGALTVFDGNDTVNYMSSSWYTFGTSAGDANYPSTGPVISPVKDDGTQDMCVAGSGGGVNGVGALDIFSITSTTITLRTIISLVANFGTDPSGVTIGPDGSIFLTCQSGGMGNSGAILKILANTIVLIDLLPFSGANGSDPVGQLVASANPGASGSIAKIQVKADGAKASGNTITNYTLFGTTFFGGTNGNGPGTGGYGTVYKINSDGTGFQTLHVFATGQNATNGYGPAGGLALSGNTLYGTTSGGGKNGTGTIFKMGTDGSNFMVLKSFSAYAFEIVNGYYNSTNADGMAPEGDLILDGSTLYGTTLEGGTNGGGGVVYSINTNGGNFTLYHSFSSPTDNGSGVFTNSDGGGTRSGLLLLRNTLYGTTPSGGTNGGGTVFAIALPLPPSLNITPWGASLTVSWPSDATNFMLQQNSTLNALTWSNFNGSMNDNGTNKSVSVTPASSSAFFRLLNTNGP